jgi:hypothetical protein
MSLSTRQERLVILRRSEAEPKNPEDVSSNDATSGSSTRIRHSLTGLAMIQSNTKMFRGLSAKC